MDRLGAAFDHDREYFTLDPALCGAVAAAFVRLHFKNLIKREDALVLWSYAFQSTISEVETQLNYIKGSTMLKLPGIDDPVEFGVFHTVIFPADDDRLSGKGIQISTMHPYTLPGDVAIAVNPDDTRYTKFHGKKVYNPLTGKAMPVIVDEVAKIDFATGAVKITPSASPLDYRIAVKHNIPFANFMNEDGTFIGSNLSPEFADLAECKNRFEGAIKIIEKLKAMGLYVGSEPRPTRVAFCKRSGDVIENRIKTQWFLDMKPGGELIKARIKNSSLQIVPSDQADLILTWLEDVKDWCVSRQIPFGHQIPAYKCIRPDNEVVWFVAPSLKSATARAAETFEDKNIFLQQDTDVLDTWFSSALLPLSALDWPNPRSAHFKNYYPLSLMETGHDILKFWVTRMIIMSTYLTGMMPFQKIYLHGMVSDAKGKKMSKSLGNAIAPIDVINGVELSQLNSESQHLYETGLISENEYKNALHTQKTLFPRGVPACGADGLRLTLYRQNPFNKQLCFACEQLNIDRNLVNKCWQAFKFFAGKSSLMEKDIKWFTDLDQLVFSHNKLTVMDKWILSQLATFLLDFHQQVEDFAVDKIYHKFITFFVECLCNTYIEVIKDDIPGQPINEMSAQVLAQCLNAMFIVMHPFIPFVSEELYQRLRHIIHGQKGDLKCVATEKYPDINVINQFHHPKINQQIDIVKATKTALREFIGTNHVLKRERELLGVTVQSSELTYPHIQKVIRKLSRLSRVELKSETSLEDVENSIRLTITNDTKVLIKADKKFLQPSLDAMDKKINQTQKWLDTQRNRGKENKDTELRLSRLKSDKDHLAKLKSRGDE